ncbi:alpha/beta fold hydrolase [Streptomyces varsoviensis]|uniref:alpha/beta fold hydrolase n=1 Tax=Streptomyces varsoviensis TaxID=67373 RepID=UPI000662BA44|nr:alpha/beta fold hydrolase [Streptomyces varsoviensis]
MTSLHHHISDGGTGDGGLPLLLGPSLGTSLAVWEPQLPALAAGRPVLRWDLPGHGGSAAGLVPDDGTATVAGLAALVLRLADDRGWERFAYAGISLGGAVGLHLAVHHPERLGALALLCSSAVFADGAAWRERAASVRADGTGPLVAPSTGRWFSRPATAAGPLGTRLLDDLRTADPAGYAACCDALATYDLRAELPRVAAPTLVVAGRDDQATPLSHARELADGIPGASLLEIAHAGHLVGVERPRAVSAALRAHFAPASGAPGPVPDERAGRN